MSYKRFNRHEIFNAEWMSFHSETINQVRDYCLEKFGGNVDAFFGSAEAEIENMLCGIWDGYLYDDLLTKALILPTEDYRRIQDTVDLINEHIETNGESVTQIF